jgi:hypothetical protein
VSEAAQRPRLLDSRQAGSANGSDLSWVLAAGARVQVPGVAFFDGGPLRAARPGCRGGAV